MKFCLTIFLFVLVQVTQLHAQSEIEKKIKQDLWVNCPKAFKNTQVPEKWKNESAVMLAFQREYVGDFTTKVTGIANVNRFYIEKINFHYRIKLQDKAAVTEFSDISFNSKTIKSNLFGRPSAYRVIGIKVIKPDGTEKEVDLSQAVKADATSARELKIPIPNLEPGDIIDYFLALRDETTTMPDFGDEYLLEMKYPVVHNIISFSLPRQFTLHTFSYNGAPEFKKEVKDKDVVHTLVDEMREKAPEMIWHSPYQTSPHFRYRISSQETKPDVKLEAKNLLSSLGYNPSDIGIIADFMEGNFKKEKDPKVIARELYFMLRNPIYMKAYYDVEVGDPLGGPGSTNRFFLLVDKYLTKNKISHDLVLAPAREYAPWENLINLASCDLFIRINSTPPVYLARPNPFSLPDEIPFSYEGATLVGGATGGPLRISTAEQNTTTTSLKVFIDPAQAGQLKIDRNITAKGHNKLQHQYLIFTNYDYMKAYDLPKYQVQSSSLMRGILKEFNKEKLKFEQRLTQDYHDRDERIKKEIESELDAKVTEYKDLKVHSVGMWDDKPQVDYSDTYIIENLSKKVGPNVMIDLGKLIDTQTEVKEDQKKRSRDVYMPYARSFTNNITLQIPEGYKVEGLENLAIKVENETGGFISTAKAEGNTVVISTRKYYTRNFFKAEDWGKIVPFLNAANNFYKSKVLLKKR
jgi:hypothetical protein